jgi:hypothetical protein
MNEAPPPLPRAFHWSEKVLGLVYAVFCLMIGLLLLILPWTDIWDVNYFANLPKWRGFWDNLYFRGAISGVGVINLYLWLLEVFQLRRFSD